MTEPLRRETRPRTHRSPCRPSSMPTGQLIAFLCAVAILATTLVLMVTDG